jgi:hypothetical protein
MCDEVSSKLSDILSINSIELGNVLRKLRLTYKQTFEQMLISWKALRNTYLSNKDEVNSNLDLIHTLKRDLENKEYELNTKFDLEVIRINKGTITELQTTQSLISFPLNLQNSTTRRPATWRS